jgi:hypothetical protein
MVGEAVKMADLIDPDSELITSVDVMPGPSQRFYTTKTQRRQ